MRWDRHITLSVVAPLSAVLPGRQARALPILMYHRIADDSETGVGSYYRLATSPKRFAEQMDLLAGLGWRATSLEEALDEKPGSAPAELRRVALTFDDGYSDFLDGALPALGKHGFTATIYLPTAYIGDQRGSFKGHPCLAWSEIRELRSRGIRFGSHTVSHPRLYDLAWDEIRRELADSKAVIEDRLGEPISSFAYPFAYPQADRKFTRGFEKLLVEHGYQSNVTTRVGRWSPPGKCYSLPRLPVNDEDDSSLLSAKLSGAYDWIAWPQALGKHGRHWLGRRRTLDTGGRPPQPRPA